MSLINDALKKAQNMRTQGPAAGAPPLPGDSLGPVAKRARPMPARWLAGIVAGAVVLVAGSVLATVFWLRKPEAIPAPKPIASAHAVSESSPSPLPPPEVKIVEPAPALKTAAPVPVAVVAPAITVNETVPVAPKTEPRPAAPLPVATPAPDEHTAPPAIARTVAPPVSEVPAPAVAIAESRPAPPPAPVPKHDARAQAFIEALRVTGIRASGSDSRVLMNDRVFRLNDIVDRPLGLRLTGVAADQLTFTDPNGMVYTRNF
ncbi:MAG TPA: hypothetical protein VMC06_00610 [Opitutaceae bacterium]|nr:hypothetical protein [Opitutaceae bacterium]